MKQTTVTLVDDLTGGPADETVEFSIDGRHYEIDLAAWRAAQLRETLGRYVAKGRRVRNSPRRGGATKVTSTASLAAQRQARKEYLDGARAWARENGYPQVSDAGRVADEILAKYEASRHA